MTKAAQEFVGTLTFQALTGKKVGTAMFGPESDPLEHVALGQEVDAIVVAPATANFIGKVAAGIGDDLLTTIMLAATQPVLHLPGHERRNVGQPGGAGKPGPAQRPGSDGDGAGGRVPWPAAQWGWAACRSRTSSWRPAPVCSCTVIWRGGGSWSPPGPPMKTSTRCGF